MNDVLAEQREYEAWDHDFTPNPHSPWGVAESLAQPEFVPQLIAALENPQQSPWALFAIERLGPRAAPAADALERRNEGAILFKVDEARARALGIDRDPGFREKIMEQLL